MLNACRDVAAGAAALRAGEALSPAGREQAVKALCNRAAAWLAEGPEHAGRAEEDSSAAIQLQPGHPKVRRPASCSLGIPRCGCQASSCLPSPLLGTPAGVALKLNGLSLVCGNSESLVQDSVILRALNVVLHTGCHVAHV